MNINKINDFYRNISFEQRKKESEDKKIKYPDLYPIIIERFNYFNLSSLKRKKFLVSNNITLFDIKKIIKIKLSLSQNETLLLFCDDKKILNDNITIYELYDKYKNEDGFLYLYYANYESFGFKKF